MYKKRKNWWSVLFTIMLIVVFSLLFFFIVVSEQLQYDRKIELCIQICGMFFTSFALILTYNSLRNEREQKHFANKPYLLLDNIDFAVEKINDKDKQLDFDFSIVNKGNGIAKKITVKIYNKKNKRKILFCGNYMNLDVIGNDVVPILADIRNELCKINSENHSYGRYFPEMINDEFYINDYVDEKEYKELKIIITYFDMYGKKYKGIFWVSLDKDFDLEKCKETLREY